MFLSKKKYILFSVLTGFFCFILPATNINAQNLTTVRSGDDFLLQVGNGTSLNDFKLNLTENQGAGIDGWYDVNDASSPTDWGPELTYDSTVCTYKNLINLNIGKSGVDLTDACDTSGNRLTVLESSPVRTILKGTSQFATWGTESAGDATWKQDTIYTVYANGRVYANKAVTRLTSQITSLTWYYPLRLFVDYNTSLIAADETLDGSLVNNTQYTAHNLDNFWMFHGDSGTTVGDVALAPFADWADSDYMLYNTFSVTGYNRIGLRDSGPRTWNPGDSDTFRFLLQIKPNDRNTNTAQAAYVNDYRSPDTLSFATGTAETLNAGDHDNDGWNTDEGTYEMVADSHEVNFTLDGSATTRYNPNFKIHEFYPQTGVGLTVRTKLHARLDDNAANTTATAQIGTNGVASGNSSTLTLSGSKRNRGFTLDDDNEYVSFSTSDLTDWKQGTLEFWYKPNYDFNQDTAPTKYLLGTGASGVSGNLYLKHEDDGAGSNRLRFGIYDEDGSPSEHYVDILESNYSDLWVTDEWTHIRLTWDSSATTDNLKIYINGWYYTQTNTDETTWATFTPGTTLYFGDYQSSGTDTAEGVFDEIYLHDDVIAGHKGAPVILDTIYSTGTITTSNGSATLTGSGTSWSGNLSAGQAIRIIGDGDEQWYEISSVGSDTSITLTRAYQGTGAAGLSYEGGGTVIVLPEMQVDATDKIIDTDYNLAQANSAATYIVQYLTNVTTASVFEFANGLLDSTTLTQNNYRWYTNTDDITPTDPWPAGGTNLAENTAISTTYTPADNAVLRLRMSVQGNISQLDADTQAFKLQYGINSTCSSVSTWFDIGDTSSTTPAFRGYGNDSVADGATISSTVLTGSDVGGSYEEENNSANNPNAITAGQDAEWDWVLQAINVDYDNNYCFRMVESDGTALDVYTRYPSVSGPVTTFDVSFEGGNGENFIRVGDAVSFDGERDIGTGDYRRTTWFYFSMNNVLGKTIAFTMNNARGANTETNVWTGKRPFYSYDQTTWYPVTNDGTDNNPAFDWNAPGDAETFTQDTVYIAYNPPYTYTDALNDITRWEASQFASSTAVIGQSVQGRDLHLLTFENTTSSIPYANKKVMWVGSRQHPMEICGSWSAQGVVDFYIDENNPEAKVFQDGWILKMIPDDNPDGMYLGQTRSNANGWDLNREWNNGAPNIGTEEIEVYNHHSTIHDWVTTQGNSIDIFLDMHSQSSAPPSAFFANTGFSHEIMEDNLGFLSNQSFNAFQAGSYAIDVVYDNYGAPAYTVEGPDVRWDSNNHPTAENCRAWGRAWAKAAISEFETNAKVFTFHEELEGTSSSDNLLVTAPGKFRSVFDEAKGGAMTYWYDIENQSNHTAQLGDLTNGVDRIEWNDGTNRVLADSTSVATSSVYIAGPTMAKITYSGNFDGQANYPYTLTKTIWEDGRIWNTFALTNNTGGSVNWADMSFYNSLTNTNFTLDRDNDDDTPTPGTDNWWSQIGNGGSGIKATLTNYFVDQVGGWVYDAYASAGGPPGTTYYRDSDGPSQANGETITVHYVTQLSPDNDLVGNEAQIDVWRDDIANPDDPTMTIGTFSGFATSTGALSFTPSSNQAVFTYTNADSYTKKKPAFVLNSYTANTAPVLKVNGSFLDSEDGSAHATSTHISTTYTSFVDVDNTTAYIQYLGDVSSNVELQMGSSLPSAAPTDVSDVSASYNSDTQVTISWTDNSNDELGFKINRRDDTGSGWGSYTQIGTVAANTTSFVDNSTNNSGNPPAANEKYQYQVLAYNIVGDGTVVTDSGTIITTPSAATIGTPTVNSSTSITWTWTDNANFEDSYRVDYATGSADDADGLAADSESWSDTDLTPNTQYAVHVHAFQTDRGESTASSNSSAVYTLANTPASLTATTDSSTQITASWNANSNAAGTEYYVENVTASTNSGWITTTSWSATGLTCDTSYTFKVKARNGDNTETSFTATADSTTSACSANNNNNNNGGGASQPTVSQGEGSIGSIGGNVITQNISADNSAQAYFPSINTTGDSIQVRMFAENTLNYQITPMPINQGFSGGGIQLEVFRNNQPITSLGVPVTLTFFYNDQQINNYGLNENSLRIYRWDEDTNSWLALTNHVIDLANNKISAQTNHFSLFALLGVQGNNPQSSTQLIKLANNPKVYVVTNGYKRHVPNEASFLSYGYNWADIETVAANTFNLYPTSELIKLINDPKVYKLENNNKRWITSEAAFNSLNLSWSAIMTVSEIEFNSYNTGEIISTTNTNYQFNNFLSLGSEGEEVRQLQIKLKSLGYFTYPSITGYYGPVTKNAVKAFQQANGISPLGYVGPSTRTALNK